MFVLRVQFSSVITTYMINFPLPEFFCQTMHANHWVYTTLPEQLTELCVNINIYLPPFTWTIFIRQCTQITEEQYSECVYYISCCQNRLLSSVCHHYCTAPANGHWPGGFPSNSVRDGSKEVGWLDEFFQDVDLHRQREAIVKHLIQQLKHSTSTFYKLNPCQVPPLHELVWPGRKASGFKQTDTGLIPLWLPFLLQNCGSRQQSDCDSVPPQWTEH